MKIKICCENMEGYINSLYIQLCDNQPTIDTALYDENETDIDYCPWCGKKIEIIKGEMP